MNAPIPNEFADLCDAYLDGALGDVETGRLARMIETDPRLADVLRSQLVVSGALARTRPELGDEAFLRNVLPHLRSLAAEEPDAFPGRVRKTIRHARWKKAVLAAAAVIVLAAIPALHFAKAAKAATLFGPDGSRSVSVGESLDFAEGVVRMEFANGAVVAIEAPASLSIESATEVVLDHGRINAWCPQSAHGFRVRTRSATLTDLGTSFGVSAARDGTAEFVVLDGKVEVRKGDETRLIEGGAALRAQQGAALEPVRFEPMPFKRTWPVASGIRSTHGNVIPAPPGTPETLAAYEDDNHIVVIPERRDFAIGREIQVNINSPGTYDNLKLVTPIGFLPSKNTKVRGYLIRFNPVGKLTPEDNKLITGSVTFDRPVLAVISASRLLHQSDGLFSIAPMPRMSELDARLRGLEPSPHLARPDSVTLTNDRRTLKLNFVAGESIDEIRAVTSDD